nr:hypothetical protein [uncultured Psychroserpens sp.]
MTQFAVIFEKIKKEFYSTLKNEKDKEVYKLLFSPFSTGFTYDDFLFLDTNSASTNVHKYYDELLEFSQIANTIPKHDNFWSVSGERNDFLYNQYKTIIENLRFFEIDTLDIEKLQRHPVFLKILDVIDSELINSYKPFFDLYLNKKKEMDELNKSLDATNKDVVNLQIKILKENLEEIKKQWLIQGNKSEVEEKAIEILADEMSRFLRDFGEIKSKIDVTKEHVGSTESIFLTYCNPNNLYNSKELEWNNIKINKQELKTIFDNISTNEYQEVFEDSDASKLEIDSISFDLIFVNLTRAWFNERLLNSPFWDINILNKEEIEIPAISSKLIFVRNVLLDVKENSTINKTILSKNLLKNIGPFIINKSLKAQTLKLNSVNSSLGIERKAVLNVASKLKTKQAFKNKKLSTIVLNKQKQFNLLAPKLKEKKAIKAADPKLIRFANFRVQPVMTAVLFNSFIGFEFQFKDKENSQPIGISSSDIKVFFKKKQTAIVFKQKKSNSLTASLSSNSVYDFEIITEGYEATNYKMDTKNFKTSSVNNLVSIELIKEKLESFQLIGVVSKAILPFPNPIKGADYI